jgi:predicted nucleotidyltransferase
MREQSIELILDRLQKIPVIFAYLFGSQATGKASPSSDIDLAVFVDEAAGALERFDLRLKLGSELTSVLRKRVDVITINDAPLGLRFEAIKHGKLILCKDRQKRIETELRILSAYLDRRYYDKRRAEIILRRIEKGSVPA